MSCGSSETCLNLLLLLLLWNACQIFDTMFWRYIIIKGYCVASSSLWFINMLSAVSRIGRISCFARVISLYIVLSSALLGS